MSETIEDHGGQPVGTGGGETYHDLARLIERLHRRFLDVLRVELLRMGVDDISPAQVMVLFTIGQDELSVRDLIERGHYLGSNASYNLKQLVQHGYVDRTASKRDRREARLRLSARGQALCDSLRDTERWYRQAADSDEEGLRDLEITARTLRQLERVWTDAVRYDRKNAAR